MAKMTVKHLEEILERMQVQLAVLTERVERLESSAVEYPPSEALPSAPGVQEPPPPGPVKVEITEEELIAISAAVAAYMGVRVHIRQIRLLSSRAWSQQGRVSIQASHNVHI